MTHLNLPPNSLELRKILHNKISFTVYSLLLAQDYAADFEKFKYVGLLTNPEGFAKIEGLDDKASVQGDTSKKYLSIESRKQLIKKDLQEAFGTPDIQEVLGISDIEDIDDGIIQL